MEIMDPSHEQHTTSQPPPQRLLVWKAQSWGSQTARKILSSLIALKPFTHRLRVSEVIRRTKANYSAPAEVELMKEAMGWDAVLSGVGD